MTSSSPLAVGCSGLPAGLHRNRYFDKLNYLECTETFGPPPRTKVLKGWRQGSPEGRFGLLAPRVISHRPTADSYPELAGEDVHLAGDFRDTRVVRHGVDVLAEQVALTSAEAVVFRSSSSLSPSAADDLRHFFGEIASADRLQGVVRAWEPGELWQPEMAVRMAAELDVALVVDPLAENPLGGNEPKPVELLDRQRPAYLRVRPLGRARRGVRQADLDEVAELAAGFTRAWVVFATNDKNKDAKGLVRALAELA